ncbi:hypothetical protein X798_01293 [Onchocerca flexuosa]|uniref:Uncharacterized protein n=2 Tax=Onchocerca flexuosa TaxID=387005 RepID=A0A238C2R4_9BILA|nr:hypothetical protein X798_01293 [Onchocerca flexuosa]
MRFMDQLMSSSDRWIALQFSFYNALLLVLTGVCLAGLFAVYRMMYMFLTPLLWATLIGTILFPFKKRFNNAINGWLSRVDNEGKPLLVAVILMPYDAFISATDLFLIHLARREGIIMLGAYLVLKILNHITFVALLHFLGDLYRNTDYIILFCSRTWVSILMMLYFAAFVGWFFVQDQHSMNKKLARLISVPLWFFGIAKISNFFGPFNVIVMSGISATLIIIASGILIREEVKADNPEKTGYVNLKNTDEKLIEDKKEKTFDQELTGDFYLQAILGLSALEFAVQHDFVSVCVLFLAIFTVMRKIGSIRNYFKLIFSSDQMIKNSLRRAVDDFSTFLVMLLLIFGSLFITVVVVFQVHGEIAHLTRLSANLLSQQPDWILDYARNYTGNQLEKSDIDDYIEQGYLKGREWLAANVRSFVGTQDPVKGELLEKELMDKLYKMWEERDDTSISSSSSATKDWMSQLEVFTSISMLKEEMVELVKANIDTIMKLAQSIWSFTAANISTLGTISFTILAIVIDFGLEIFNFFIEITVFLTALYYLLASSQDIWLPIKCLRDALPSSHDSDSGFSYIIPAIEKAISGVFVLSAKMSLFYVLAAIFASIPVVAPCFVCIFGFVELYFAEHETAAAILFVLMSLAPKAFAETAFYNELRGSHPYVTGLAIIGGMYWLGLQGAIIGPILLCSMIVLMHVYAQFAHA